MTAAQPSQAPGVPDPGLAAAPERDLDVLLACAATGDEAAFMRVYDVTVDCVYTLALRLLRDRADAEDAATATYLEVWSTSSRFDPGQQSAATRIMTTAHGHIVALLSERAELEPAQLTDVRRRRAEPLSIRGSARYPTTAPIGSWALRVGTEPGW